MSTTKYYRMSGLAVYFPIKIFFSFSISLGTPYGWAIESLGDRLPILASQPYRNVDINSAAAYFLTKVPDIIMLAT